MNRFENRRKKTWGSLILALMLVPASAVAGVWAHYPFDDGYDDASGNGQNGTLTDVGIQENSGIVTSGGDWKFGGGAMHFGPERDFVAIPSKTFPSGTPYTIAFWAKKTAGDSGGRAEWDMVLGQRDNSNFFIALNDVNGTGLRWRSSSSAAERQADFAIVKDYEWHHYAFVASGGTITLYVDGAPFGTAANKLTGFIVDTIGEAYNSGANFDFHGQIDELWILDEAVDAAAITSLHETNQIGSGSAERGFLHRYDGDFSDSSGLGNDGTPEGGASIATDPDAIASGPGALGLDGGDGSFVTLGTPLSFGAGEPWTATWWARRGETGGDKGMVMGNASDTTNFIWLNDSFSGLRFRSSGNVTLDFAVPKDTQLRHYALVAEGSGNLSLYLDGQLSQTLSGSTAFLVNAIGKAYPTTSLKYNFQGSLDEVRLTGEALDAAAVEQIYDAEKPDEGPLPSTVTRLRVILLGGQSNADGRAPVSELPSSPIDLRNPQNDVSLFYKVEGNAAVLTTLRPGLSETSQFGPEITLGRRYADLYQEEPGTRVAIIKYANGGTSLRVQWKAGGDATTAGDGPEYVIFQQTAAQGMAALSAAFPDATLDLEAMVWFQGETDAVAGSSEEYGANLQAFIADVRATYRQDLPFVIGKLSSNQTALSLSHLNAVRAAQEAVAAADPRTSILRTDGFGMKGDNLHFDGSGQQAIGAGFAGEAAYLAWMLATFSAGEIDAGIAEPDADPDGDGNTNRSEFLGASNPLSAVSTFEASLVLITQSEAEISYPSSAARSYRVEHYNGSAGVWEMILPALRGSGENVIRSLELSASNGIYRVGSELP